MDRGVGRGLGVGNWQTKDRMTVDRMCESLLKNELPKEHQGWRGEKERVLEEEIKTIKSPWWGMGP